MKDFTERRQLKVKEHATGDLFGKLFPAYDDKLFLSSLDLFAKRFKANKFNLNWFKGKQCLDAGCGGGRYSMAMAGLGAKEVTGVDVSSRSIEDARRRANAMRLQNVSFRECSLLRLPFDNRSFDCVIFSGVLMHTADPVRVLDEVCRVLRPGGMLYMLVYATEGVRWPLVQMLRPIAQMAGFKFMDKAVSEACLAVNRRRTYLDDLFVPYIDFFSWQCIKGMLEERGMDRIRRWDKGRFDHEESIESYIRDMEGFRVVFDAACMLATRDKNKLQRSLQSSLKIIDACLTHIKEVDKSLPNGQAELAAIGQGHHRIVAWKV